MNIKLRSLALAALLFVGLPLGSSSAFVAISVGIAPPLLPIYVQPPCPVDGYLWTPGYWAYSDIGYYWVPGVWVAPPRIGFLWTPGYWGFGDGGYFFHTGYWGPTVGFYGGVNYGYGYGGSGYYGGEWAGDRFRYNTAVTRVNTTVIRNTYVNRSVLNRNVTRSRASFNGPGGVKAQPTAQQQTAANAEKAPPTPEQQKVEQAASKNPDFHAAKNHGKPKVAAIKTPDQIAQQPAAADAAASKKPPQKPESVRKDEATPREPQSGNDRQAAAKAGPSQKAEPRATKATQREVQADNPVASRGGKPPTQAAPRRPERAAQRQTASAPRARGEARVVQPTKKKPTKKAEHKGDGER